MLTSLLTLAITLLIVGAIGYVIYLFISWLPLPAVLKQIAYIILGIVLLVWLLDVTLGIGPGINSPLLSR